MDVVDRLAPGELDPPWSAINEVGRAKHSLFQRSRCRHQLERGPGFIDVLDDPVLPMLRAGLVVRVRIERRIVRERQDRAGFGS